MISSILIIIVYGILGTGILGVGVGIYTRWGLHGLINIGLIIFALPFWLYVIFRVFNNLTRSVENHFTGFGEGLLNTQFIVSLVIIAITTIIALIHRNFWRK